MAFHLGNITVEIMSKSVVRPHCSKSHRSFFITTQTLTSGAKSYTLIRKSEKDWDAQHCSESKMSFSLLTCMFSNSITQKHNMQCTTYQEEEKKKKKVGLFHYWQLGNQRST